MPSGGNHELFVPFAPSVVSGVKTSSETVTKSISFTGVPPTPSVASGISPIHVKTATPPCHIQPESCSSGSFGTSVLSSALPAFTLRPGGPFHSEVLQHSETGILATANNPSLHESLPDGAMDREDWRRFISHESQPQNYGSLQGIDAPADSVHVDTDLCLSLVNETRPSYDLKTSGKTPLSAEHLLSLLGEEALNSQNRRVVSHHRFDISTSNSQPPPPQTYRSAPIEPRHSGYEDSVELSRPSGLSNGNVPRRPKSAVYERSSSLDRPMTRPLTPQYATFSHKDRPRFETPIRFKTDVLFEEFERRLGRFAPSPVPRSASQTRIFTKPLPPPDVRPVSQQFESGRTSPFVSPRAKGLAPPPTDQPVTRPVHHGVEGQVDHLTIDMLNRMRTGKGAAGENICAKCGEAITPGRGGCTATNQTFHLDCFTCCICSSKLAGSPFYSVDGKPYCEKDYQETLEKCDVCHKPIHDRILRASARPYHPQCFICILCGTILDGVPFTVDADNLVHCVKCFHEKYAPRCAICSKPIVPEEGNKESVRVVAMDKSFHVDCYKCEDCGLKLTSKIEGHGCYPLDSHLLCKNCNAARVRILSSNKQES